MDALRIGGTILIGGFLLWVAAGVIAPPGLYREPDIPARVVIVGRHLSRWYVSQAAFALGALAQGVGYLVLTRSELAGRAPWLAAAGASAWLIAGAIAAIAIVRQTLDPVAFWSGPTSSLEAAAGVGLLLLTMLGLFIWGLLFAREVPPAWIGYLMSASAVAMIIVYAASRGGGGFFLVSIAYATNLIAGIALVRQPA